MTQLVDKKCRPCEGGVAPLSCAEAQALMEQLNSRWTLDDDVKAIRCVVNWPTFSRTMAFANALAWIATIEGHHPELRIRYGSCTVIYTTTAIKGLSTNDFICAAKIDRLLSEFEE